MTLAVNIFAQWLVKRLSLKYCHDLLFHHTNSQRASRLVLQAIACQNIISRILTIIAALFSAIAVLPLVLVLGYVLVKGGSKLSVVLFTELPPPPGLEGGGIANAIIGTLVVTIIAGLIAIPVGVGGGIFLAEYSRGGWFAQFIRFGTNVLSGVPSIIAGVFIYGTIVTSASFSAMPTARLPAVWPCHLMLPTVIRPPMKASGSFQAAFAALHSVLEPPVCDHRQNYRRPSRCHRGGVVHRPGGRRNRAADLHGTVLTVLV